MTNPDPTIIVTTNPDFLDLALQEVEKSAPRSTLAATLAPGVVAMVNEGGFFSVADEWMNAPPIFVRHIAPVMDWLDLDSSDNDILQLSALVQSGYRALFEPSVSFSVQTRIFAQTEYKPYDVNTALAEQLTAAGFTLDVREPGQILSVAIAERDDRALLAYVGVSLAAHNLSNWAGGARRFAREEGQISRAEFKLLEALESFQIDLPARGVALDLGAAPGGWTRVLRSREQYVTAVDPGELHASLGADSGVRYLATTAEAYLRRAPDVYDLIVNDMRMDARDSARLIVSYAPYLRRQGSVLMTLKLPGSNRTRILEHTLRILRQEYRVAGARQLFHNRSEITLYLRH